MNMTTKAAARGGEMLRRQQGWFRGYQRDQALWHYMQRRADQSPPKAGTAPGQTAPTRPGFLRRSDGRPQSLDDAVAEADRLVRADGTGDASRLLQAVLLVDPHRTDAVFLLGIASFRRGNRREAERRFTRVTELDPGHHGAWHYLGVIRERDGDIGGPSAAGNGRSPSNQRSQPRAGSSASTAGAWLPRPLPALGGRPSRRPVPLRPAARSRSPRRWTDQYGAVPSPMPSTPESSCGAEIAGCRRA